jgi:hypothetical protein
MTWQLAKHRDKIAIYIYSSDSVLECCYSISLYLVELIPARKYEIKKK